MALLVAGLCIWIFWSFLRAPDSAETPFVDFLGSRFIGAAVFGSLFGILFGYWFSSVVFRNPGDKPTYTEIAIGIVMAAVLLVGLAGQNVVASLITRLNTVEIAGAKLGFDANALPKSTAFAQTYNHSGTTQDGAPDQSAGLDLIAQLWDGSGQIERDRRYVRLIAKANGFDNKSIDGDFRRANEQLALAFKPLISCMALFYDQTADDDRLWALLAPIASGMRKFALSDPTADEPPPKAAWEDAFWSAVRALQNEAPMKKLQADGGCRELFVHIGKDEGAFLQPLRDNFWRSDPYFHLIIASMLAYGHEYQQALLILDHAIKCLADYREANVSEQDHPDFRRLFARRLIQNLRLRGAIVTYLEEWLHGFAVYRVGGTLLDYQLNNITEEVEVDFKSHLFDTNMSVATHLMQSADASRIPSFFGRTHICRIS